MSGSSVADQIRRTRSMVERWHGRPATMMELTSSHKTLVVLVYGESKGKNLLVACIEPEYICGPTFWGDSHIEIEPAALQNGEQGVALVDAINGVRITAGAFEVKEHVKRYM